MKGIVRIITATALFVALVLAPACSPKTPVAPKPSDGSTSPTEAPNGEQPQVTPREDLAVVYLMNASEKLVPVRVQAEAADRKAALQLLFDGPDADAIAAGLTSSIPGGTKLLDLQIEGGTASIDVSKEFGSGGGSLSMMSRIAQVVFTLTRESDVKRVEFLMEGETVTALGGEGIVIEKPQTRADWEEFSPAILVESPVLGDTAESPIAVTGTANVFEAQFRLAIKLADGSAAVDLPVRATSGSGTRGTFEASLEFDAPSGSKVSLVAYDPSEKDGTPIESMTVRLMVK